MSMIHFSDGVKAVCGAEDVPAVKDPQVITCKKCQAIIDGMAQKAGDPIVRALIFHQDLQPGQDFNFTYEGVGYHGISGAIHRIPKSVADHLKRLAYPISAYKDGQDAGSSIVVVGNYHRFHVEIKEVMEASKKTATKEASAAPKKTPAKEAIVEVVENTFKKDDHVLADGYLGTVVKVLEDGEYIIEFDDGDEGTYSASELTLS